MKLLRNSCPERLLAAVLCTVLLATATTRPAQSSPMRASSPVPVLAYYYIWFDSNSWNRAKIDYPLLGRYTSDDRAVMRQHIEWAKAAGITGFLVSWKGTDALNRRLQLLTDVAESENFKLGIIYEGLDFSRTPLSADKIAADFDYFIKNFAGRKPFQLFPKPLLIWSGTWQFSTQDVARVTQSRRNALLILASEKNVDGYLRLANSVDGDAYYWSSVNPDTMSGYQSKLVAMSQAVHQHQGIWIPPAAPGFDARLIGGTSVVGRQNGNTFRTQINTAMASSPDALGIISWNEFSENSYIEPSKQYGAQYLDILSEVNHLPPPDVPNFDSSLPSAAFPEVLPHSRAIALGAIAAMIVFAFILISRRSRSVRR
jgi:glycosyl hydrolase family 99